MKTPLTQVRLRFAALTKPSYPSPTPWFSGERVKKLIPVPQLILYLSPLFSRKRRI